MRPRRTLRERMLILLLALGTVGGFAGGIASIHRHHHHRHHSFRQTVTDICADGVRQALPKDGQAGATQMPSNRPPSPSW